MPDSNLRRFVVKPVIDPTIAEPGEIGIDPVSGEGFYKDETGTLKQPFESLRTSVGDLSQEVTDKLVDVDTQITTKMAEVDSTLNEAIADNITDANSPVQSHIGDTSVHLSLEDRATINGTSLAGRLNNWLGIKQYDMRKNTYPSSTKFAPEFETYQGKVNTIGLLEDYYTVDGMQVLALDKEITLAEAPTRSRGADLIKIGVRSTITEVFRMRGDYSDVDPGYQFTKTSDPEAVVNKENVIGINSQGALYQIQFKINTVEDNNTRVFVSTNYNEDGFVNSVKQLGIRNIQIYGLDVKVGHYVIIDRYAFPVTERDGTSITLQINEYSLMEEAVSSLRGQIKDNIPIDIARVTPLGADPVVQGDHLLTGDFHEIPICVVHRRNQGVYHADLNPNGTALLRDELEIVLDERDGTYEYLIRVKEEVNDAKPVIWESGTETSILVVRDRLVQVLCNHTVDIGKTTTEQYPIGTINHGPSNIYSTSVKGFAKKVGEYTSGSLASGTSGRPDGLYHDLVIKSDVTDLRRKFNNSGVSTAYDIKRAGNTLMTQFNEHVKVIASESASTTHTFKHGLTSDLVQVSVWVRDNSSENWANDFVGCSTIGPDHVTISSVTPKEVLVVMEDLSSLTNLIGAKSPEITNAFNKLKDSINDRLHVYVGLYPDKGGVNVNHNLDSEDLQISVWVQDNNDTSVYHKSYADMDIIDKDNIRVLIHESNPQRIKVITENITNIPQQRYDLGVLSNEINFIRNEVNSRYDVREVTGVEGSGYVDVVHKLGANVQSSAWVNVDGLMRTVCVGMEVIDDNTLRVAVPEGQTIKLVIESVRKLPTDPSIENLEIESIDTNGVHSMIQVAKSDIVQYVEAVKNEVDGDLATINDERLANVNANLTELNIATRVLSVNVPGVVVAG